MSKPSASAPRKRRSAAEARREILDAAQARLERGGPEAVRLQEVAADVGISHPTVLHHFGSRDGLLEALSRRAVEGLTEDLLGKLRTGDLSTMFERVEHTFGDAGFARLLAWNVLSGRTRPDDVKDQLIKRLAESELAHDGQVPDDAQYREILFRIRLSALALFGEVLIGPLLTRSAGQSDEVEVHREFVHWLASLLSDTAPHGH